MELQITSLDMRYSFETKTTTNVLKALLPTGRELEFEVSEEEVNALMAADGTKVAEEQEAAVIDNSSEPRLIEWALLPDNLLEPGIKDALYRGGLPPAVTEDQLMVAVRSIATRVESTTSYEPTEQLGVVERGVPLPQRSRSRRVESDDRGNPVVPQSEAIDDDRDEDTGVRSV